MTIQTFKRNDGTYLNVEYIDAGAQDTLVYLHGLLSCIKSKKAQFLKEYAQHNHINFLTFDFTSHGDSWGQPKDWRIGRCLNDALDVLNHYLKAPALVVGSSMGGYIGLLLAEYAPDKLKALIGLAPGADFMRSIWKNMLTAKQKELLKQGIIFGPDESTRGYCFSYEMFKDARHFYQLHKKIPYTGPVRIIQGDKDALVPYQTALKIKDALTSEDVRITLIKGAEHKLSEPDQLNVLGRTLDEFINNKSNN